MTVLQPDAPLFPNTQVTSDELLQIAFADHVILQFADGETIHPHERQVAAELATRTPMRHHQDLPTAIVSIERI